MRNVLIILSMVLLFFTSCSNNSDKEKERLDSLAANAIADSLLKAAIDSTDSSAAGHTVADSVKH